MKPTLYWALARRTYGGYEVMRVTSVKAMRMVYGSDVDGMPTHKKPHHVKGRFDSQEAAAATLSEVDACTRRHNERRRELDRQRGQIAADEDAEIAAIMAKAQSQAVAA